MIWALVQFKDIKVRLKKGSERGYVIVVFVVSEANHIQYNVDLNYSYSKSKWRRDYYVEDVNMTVISGAKYRDESKGENLLLGVTDFNIFSKY